MVRSGLSCEITLLGLLEVDDVPDGIEILSEEFVRKVFLVQAMPLTSGFTFLYWR